MYVRCTPSTSAKASALALIEETELATAQWTRAIPGGVALFTQAQRQAAVVTSASAQLATKRLHAAGYPQPAALIAGSDVRDGKPSPEGYLRAATKLSVPINKCAIFEDSPAGVSAARAAQAAQVIIIGNAVSPEPGEIAVPNLDSLRWTGIGLALTTT